MRINFLLLIGFLISSLILTGQQKLSIDIEPVSDKDSIIIIPININTNHNYTSPILINNTFYFTSSRNNQFTDKAALRFNDNIYEGDFENNEIVNLKMHYFFNSDNHTSLAGYSLLGPKLFTYKTFGGGDLYYSILNNDKWTNPKRFKKPINTIFQEQSATESESIMVISSNRNSENFNLYWSIKNNEGLYSSFSPIDIINTNGNEIDVTFGPDGKTLYFSSSGRSSNNAYNIYYSSINETGNWTNPVELNETINSLADERWFFVNDSLFFFSSNRDGFYNIYSGYLVKKVVFDDLLGENEEEQDSLTSDEFIIDFELDVDLLSLDGDKREFKESSFADLNELDFIFFDLDGNPDTNKQNKLINLLKLLDSLNFELSYAYVQIGAFYSINNLNDFLNNYQAFDTTAIFIEKESLNNRTLNKFLIKNKYFTIQSSILRQQVALKQQINQRNTYKSRYGDAFVAVYDKNNKRILIYFNADNDDFKLIIDNETIHF